MATQLPSERTTPGADDRLDGDWLASELPDIIDVVMQMARDGAEAADASSSPPQPEATPNRVPAHLETLADHARKYVEAASSANTRRAYAADWKHFCAWARRQGFSIMPPDPQTVGLYIAALASGSAVDSTVGAGTGGKKSVSTIERRLSALTWNFTQRGQPLDRKDRHIATVMAGIRNKHACRATINVEFLRQSRWDCAGGGRNGVRA